MLGADMIFGKDRAWPKPRRDSDAAGSDSKADLGSGGVGIDPRATELKTDLFRLRVYHPSKATTG